MDWLTDALRLGRGSVVVDLAAGTGRLSRPLARTGARVIAVEPVEAMRAKLAGATDRVELVGGIAEAMPLRDRTADAITVAQALHWFDLDRALPELRRVLRPDGRLAVVYNHRDLSHPLFREAERIVDPYRGDAPSHRHDRPLDTLDASPLFTRTAGREFENRQALTVAGFIDRITSTSYVAALPEPLGARVESALRALVADAPEPIVLDYRTAITLYVPARGAAPWPGAAPTSRSSAR